MPCKQCGCALELTQNSGGVAEGSFTERYKCVGCSALGSISGEASEPAQNWNRTGSAFSEY